jgi:hypothetical protein
VQKEVDPHLTRQWSGYARERLLLCRQIVRRLADDKIERMFMRLIKQQCAVIDAVAMAEPRTWLEVHVSSLRRREAQGIDPLATSWWSR